MNSLVICWATSCHLTHVGALCSDTSVDPTTELQCFSPSASIDI